MFITLWVTLKDQRIFTDALDIIFKYKILQMFYLQQSITKHLWSTRMKYSMAVKNVRHKTVACNL